MFLVLMTETLIHKKQRNVSVDMASAVDEAVREPVPTRVWDGDRDWGSKCGCPENHFGGSEALRKLKCPNILYKEPPARQLCTTRENVERYIQPKFLKDTPQQYYQEFRADDVVNLVMDLDDNDCPDEPSAEAKVQEYRDWVEKMCKEKLKMNVKAIRDNVAYSSSVRPNKDPKKKGLYKGGMHVVINGFVCRFGSQYQYFEQNGWVASCPLTSIAKDSLDNIYNSRRLLRLINNKKKSADTETQTPMTLTKSTVYWKHVPSVFDGHPQNDVTPAYVVPNVVPPTPKKKILPRSNTINAESPAYKPVPEGQDAEYDETRYYLFSIDPDGDREERFLIVFNYMKFS
eukprot:SAG11_NODE_5521_length_1536_cov_47.366736_1_plen_344_part_10